EDRPALLVGVDCPLDACHLLTPCSGAAVVLTRPGNRLGPGLTYGARSGRRASLAEKLLDLRGVARGHLGVAGEATRHTGRLVLEQVALAGTLAEHLAGAGDLEALAGTAVRLVLRHSAVLSSSVALLCPVTRPGTVERRTGF